MEIYNKLFVGSSKESLELAHELQTLIIDRIEGINPIAWDQDQFYVNRSNLESLIKNINEYSYACFILNWDDRIISRGNEGWVTRDNVIFEIGLFLGALGRDRVYIIYDFEKKPKLPSDFDGITLIKFREFKPLSAALSPVCGTIEKEIQKTKFYLNAKNTKKPFQVYPLDKMNSRWNNLTERLDSCKRNDEVKFISITGKNFLLPHPQEGHEGTTRLAPKALINGVQLKGVVYDPTCNESIFRADIESPNAEHNKKLLISDAHDVTDIYNKYKNNYELDISILNNLKLRYFDRGLSFGLWLFDDVGFVEPFHFGKRKGVQHLCGFSQIEIKYPSEEYDLLHLHFDILWTNSNEVSFKKVM